ncbi:MAG: phytanoyl-CoA dioxygenase family protein [Sneathiella sp.]
MRKPLGKEAWLKLAPGLTIGSDGSPPPLVFLDTDKDRSASKLHDDGYFQMPPVFTEAELAPVRNALLHFRDEKIPPVYIYLYDQPWHLFHRLTHLIEHFLGDKYAILPNLWAWHLAVPGEAGWSPHRDCDADTVFDIGGDKILMSLSLWLPLTDTTPENGGMYVLPRTAQTGSDEIDLTKGVALPARAGSVLGWAQDLYHWGGEYTADASGPRLSLSLEFQNRAFDPLIEPLLDFSKLPSFDERLALIDAQFAKYRHIDR